MGGRRRGQPRQMRPSRGRGVACFGGWGMGEQRVSNPSRRAYKDSSDVRAECLREKAAKPILVGVTPTSRGKIYIPVSVCRLNT
jgi:hypothetical protein